MCREGRKDCKRNGRVRGQGIGGWDSGSTERMALGSVGSIRLESNKEGDRAQMVARVRGERARAMWISLCGLAALIVHTVRPQARRTFRSTRAGSLFDANGSFTLSEQLPTTCMTLARRLRSNACFPAQQRCSYRLRTRSNL